MTRELHEAPSSSGKLVIVFSERVCLYFKMTLLAWKPRKSYFSISSNCKHGETNATGKIIYINYLKVSSISLFPQVFLMQKRSGNCFSQLSYIIATSLDATSSAPFMAKGGPSGAFNKALACFCFAIFLKLSFVYGVIY